MDSNEKAECEKGGVGKTVKTLEYEWQCRIRAVLIFITAWFVLCVDQVHAAGTSDLTEKMRVAEQACIVNLSVSVQNAAGTVVIEPGDEGTPMPEQTELQIDMNKTKAFGEIRYNTPEDYHYRIYQKSGQQEGVTYDSSVYDVTVRVVRMEDGTLTADVWCRNEGEEEKADKIIFTNTIMNETIEREPVKTPEIKKAGIITTNHKTVKTGDMAPIGMLVALSGLSAGTMTAIAKWKKKEE